MAYIQGFFVESQDALLQLLQPSFHLRRKITKNILRQLGFFNIAEADDGTMGLEALQKDHIDLIISDWNMPQMTGLDFLKKVRQSEEFRNIPFLMVTAEAQKENVLEAAKAGVSNYIVKPFTAEAVEEKLIKILKNASA